MTNRLVGFTPQFTQEFKQLQKRFRRIADDLSPLLKQLRDGQTPGDQIPGVGYVVYKVRVRNSDAKQGKSGGYRVIYYLKTADRTIIVTIYSKTDQTDIPAQTIRRIIAEYEEGNR